MKKHVKIVPEFPIYGLTPLPINETCIKDLIPEAIRICLLAGAKVYELLPGRVEYELNLDNYDKDNSKFGRRIHKHQLSEEEKLLQEIKKEQKENE